MSTSVAKAIDKNTLARAIHKNIRITPRKLNLVAGLIRGRNAAEALLQLQFSRKRISKEVKKCLESAIANAENNQQLDVGSLVVHEVIVGKAIVMKRMMPRARGRGDRIKKFLSHLKIILRAV
jgi:large subunit ribosomal protein L22